MLEKLASQEGKELHPAVVSLPFFERFAAGEIVVISP
jgi:hypothetical protein